MECKKICRGSEWKKHKASFPTHTRSWRRLFCSAHITFEHAHSHSRKFIKKHSACTKHKSIANPNFRQFIIDTRRELGDEHNLSPAEDSDEETEKSENEETEEEERRNVNTDGEEEEDLLGDISEDYEEDEVESEFVIVEETSKCSKDMEEGEKEPENLEASSEQPQTSKNDEPQSSNKEETQTTNGEQSQTSKGEQSEKEPNSKTPAKKGIKKQNKKWQDDEEVRAVSRMRFLEQVYQKYLVLEKTHKNVLQEYSVLQSKQLAARSCQEEAAMAKASLRCKTVEIGKAQSKIAYLEDRLQFSSKIVKEREEEMARLKTQVEDLKIEKEEMKNETLRREMEQAASDTQLFELHLPLKESSIIDEVLVYDLRQSNEIECYESPMEGINCLHLLLERRGQKISMKEVKRRRKRARTSLPPEPEAQRARFSP